MEKVECILDRDAAIALQAFHGHQTVESLKNALAKALADHAGEAVVVMLDREAALGVFKDLQDSLGVLHSAFLALDQCLARPI